MVWTCRYRFRSPGMHQEVGPEGSVELIGLIALMAAVSAGMYVLSALFRIVRSIERIERHLVTDPEGRSTDANIDET